MPTLAQEVRPHVGEIATAQEAKAELVTEKALPAIDASADEIGASPQMSPIRTDFAMLSSSSVYETPSVMGTTSLPVSPLRPYADSFLQRSESERDNLRVTSQL